MTRRLTEHYRIILLAAEGKTDKEIEATLQITRQKAGRWRERYLRLGRAGWEQDAAGRGRKPTYREIRQAIVRKTTRETPPYATHWSLESMDRAMDISPRTVGRVWREHGLKRT